jgi:signal transduction histidine kinase
MKDELRDLTKEDLQNIAVSLNNAAINIYGLIENLLEWSLLQRGIIYFIPKSYYLLSKFESNLASVFESANKKGVKISFEIPDDTILFADENMLSSIIRNIVGNAVKFTPKGGNIIVRAKTLSDKKIEISVKDSGIGMSEELLGKLFQLDGNTSRKGTEGEASTGLGLIICKDFVEKHGGKIWAESVEGKGSTFYFTIPV